VIVKDLNRNVYEEYKFDAVLVCNGHYHTPSIPKYRGSEIYAGKQIHSHDYRSARSFKGETVLIIGGKETFGGYLKIKSLENILNYFSILLRIF
jgi:cation diffusion facilitator CzcD-associated flavoprotein CzcO